MHRLNFSFLAVGLAICVFAFAGCGETPTEVNFVEGKVTLDGKIVTDATVTFQPVVEGQGVSATGMTDENGIYKLTAVGSEATGVEAQSGTVPGEYYVGVVKMAFDDYVSEQELEEAGKDTADFEIPGGEEDTAKHAVPERYNNPQTSGIKKTVTAGSNTLNIDLTTAETGGEAGGGGEAKE